MPVIDGERLLGDLRRLAEFGRYKTGVHRPTYSAEDIAARHWLAERMSEAGLAVELDGIGNVIGRSPGEGPRPMLGSHSELQNQAGWLDGALGVVYAIEVARALRGDPAAGGRNIDVVCFADEEGHFSNFTGSRSFVGELSEAEIDRTRNRYDGTPLRDALERAGLAGRPRAADRSRAHQRLPRGPHRAGRLSRERGAAHRRGHQRGRDLAVPDRLRGRAEPRRHDAHGGAQGRRAWRWCASPPRSTGASPRSRARARSGPPGGSRSSPARRASSRAAPRCCSSSATSTLRSSSGCSGTLEELVAAADAEGPCRCRLEVISRSVPKLMDERLLAALDAAAEQHAPGAWMRMPSAAGHDAQIVAQRVPAAMLFVPSIGGISHHWTENTARR